jgi:predicted HD phosphohydrolase
VDAKRCLCAVDAAYFSTLSADSVRSLKLQGGIFSTEEADDFMHKPFAQDALSLRRWDDLAKCPERVTPSLDHYIQLIERLSESHRTVS